MLGNMRGKGGQDDAKTREGQLGLKKKKRV